MCGACAPAIGPVTYSIMPAALTPVDAEHNKAKDFARVFCSTLAHLKDKDGRPWGDCGRYLEATEAPQAQAALTTRYRFMVVPGFGGECLRDVRAFSTSIAHLKDAHKIDVEYFAVAPFGSSEENGKSTQDGLLTRAVATSSSDTARGQPTFSTRCACSTTRKAKLPRWSALPVSSAECGCRTMSAH